MLTSVPACRPVVSLVVVASFAWAALVLVVLVGRGQQRRLLRQVMVRQHAWMDGVACMATDGMACMGEGQHACCADHTACLPTPQAGGELYIHRYRNTKNQ